VELSSQQFARLYRAFRRGDQAFDGRAYVAVRTTGIYCLLSCRARKPKRENIRFYFSRPEVERDGFRPCRKCRPEVHGGRRALERAVLRRWLERLADADTQIGELARAEGSSASRLYRIFRRHLGRGPRDARAQARLRRVCDLLRSGEKSVAAAAYDAGFGSLATFYRWFRRGVGMTPARFRAQFSRLERIRR
jgi:methylphosphotriester-DNA--protein-cysteine methyltransferase